MSGLMHWYVAIITVASILACIWLIRWSSKQSGDIADDETMGHTWDGDLAELNNPLPRWWLYLFYITIVFALVYLVLYPGLGNFAGTLGWSQESQYDAEIADANERYEPIYAALGAQDAIALTGNPDALKLGASLYASYCTTCHGSDARGAVGYPNLTDDEWLWGDSEAQIVSTIKNGRVAVMPALAPALGGDEGVANMTSYVRSLSGLEEADDAAAAMQPMFVALCGACHQATGVGNPILGAPNLTDDVWLYGSSPEAITTALVEGRNGAMPAHGDLLGDNRTKILAAYVYNLSSSEREAE